MGPEKLAKIAVAALEDIKGRDNCGHWPTMSARKSKKPAVAC
jgi:hypothetical protein